MYENFSSLSFLLSPLIPSHVILRSWIYVTRGSHVHFLQSIYLLPFLQSTLVNFLQNNFYKYVIYILVSVNIYIYTHTCTHMYIYAIKAIIFCIVVKNVKNILHNILSI